VFIVLVSGMSLVGCKTHYKIDLADLAKNAGSHSGADCKEIVSAAWEGRYQTVKTLLNRGVSPNCVFAGKSALLAAARYGKSWHWDQNIDTVKLLVEHGANIDFKYSNNGKVMTPTYIAAYAGHTKTAIYLVSKGGSLKEAEAGHRKYVARESGSLAALGLMAEAANAFSKSMASGSSDLSSDDGLHTYKCKFHCEGQFGVKRGGDKTVRVNTGSIMDAENYVKEQYKDVCDMYPFYSSGRGATVGTVYCQKELNQ